MNHPNHKPDAHRRLLPAWVEPPSSPIDLLADRSLDKRFVKRVFYPGPSQHLGSDELGFPPGLPLTPELQDYLDDPVLLVLDDLLTPEQRDYRTCQQARQAAESEIRRNYGEHMRFQELWSATPRREAELDTNPDLRVHLNPIRVWARFVTPVLLEGETDLPTEVFFFATADAIRAAVLEPKAHVLLNVLAWFSPCTVRQFWLLNQHSDRSEIARFCRDLAQIGLVAFG